MTVTMMQLREYGQCRTVLGGQGPDTIFCGDATAGVKPYCAACCSRYYVVTQPYVRKRKRHGVEAMEREYAAA